MSQAHRFEAEGHNRLLAALPTEDYARLVPHLQLETLSLKQMLYGAGQAIEQVWFPLTGVTSIITTLDDGAVIEVGMVGNEGLVGLPAFLGATAAPTTAICQVPGIALRLETQVLRTEARRGAGLLQVLLRYTQAFFNQVAQTAACNRHHTVYQRCSRWLLMTHDRVGADLFPLTQEFLAQMLDVRRASVNEVARALQADGLIYYQRGIMQIMDRAELEAAACGCYQVIREEYERLLS